MSVRTEARDQLSPAMQQALHVSPEQLQMAGVPMAAQTAAPVDAIGPPATSTMALPSKQSNGNSPKSVNHK